MQKKNWKKSFLIPILRLAVFLLFIFINVGATNVGDILIYVTPPISSTTILPTSDISSQYLTSTISISASPGEYKPATFTVKANSAINQMTVTASDLTSGGNTISSGNIDLKVVKVWWQAGSGSAKSTNRLVPELLLKDDALVDVDGSSNYLKVAGWNDATATGFYAGYAPTSTTGSIGQAIDFDGSQAYLSITDSTSTSPTSAITLSAWVKRGSTSTADGIIGKYQSAENKRSYLLGILNDVVKFSISADGGIVNYGETVGTTNIDADTWYHIAGVYDGLTMQIYVNGQPEGTPASYSSGIYDSSVSLRLGDGDAGYWPFDGAIDDVRIYNTALSAQEVEDLYNASGDNYVYSAAPSNLVGWWTMDDADSTTTTIVYGRGNQYLLASDSSGIAGTGGSNPTVTEFPIQDSATLRPIDIEAGTNKQFWITAYIPPGTPAGDYTGTITLTADDVSWNVNINLTVLPITLAEPSLEYSIYYVGHLGSVGTIGYITKNTAQMTAELNDLYKHGIINPIVYGQDSDAYLEGVLDIRSSVGISNAKIYQALGSPMVAASVSTTTLQEGIAAKLALLAPYGTTEYYVYGDDETDMYPVRTKMDAAHAAGAKILNAQGSSIAINVADKLDVGAIAYDPDSVLAQAFHKYGNKVYNYANPETASEDAEEYRENYGLLLWQNNYDGMMVYAYQANSGNIWDDWAPSGSSRQFAIAYPTVNGVVSTIQEEGLREAVNDIRYLTTLQNLINSQPAGKSTQSAENYLNTLKTADLTAQDLDAVRQRMIDYILYLSDEGSAPSYYSRCGNDIVETGEECDGTDLNGGTCTSLGYDSGSLSCNTLCQYRESSCLPSSLSTSFSTSTDYDSGYINKDYINYGLSVTSATDTSAYADLTGSDQTLIAYWGMNEATSTTVGDLSNSGNGGTLAAGDYETANDGTTSSTIQESGSYVLSQTSSYYNIWTFEALDGAAAGTTSSIGRYTVTSYLNSRQIYPVSPLEGFASGDQYHIYYNDDLALWTEGVRGSALHFDGKDDYVALGTAAPSINEIGGDQMSISLWFKNDGLTATSQYLIEKNGAFSLAIMGSTNKLRGVVYTAQGGAYDYIVLSTDSIVEDQWYHAALVYNGLLLKLYINGELADSDDLTGDVTSEGCTQIGRYNNGGCYGDGSLYFDGIIDEVMIFKRALSLSEVKALYNSTTYPLSYISDSLTAGSHGVIARVIDAEGSYIQTATSTITVATSTAGSALNFIDYGLTKDIKLLAGSSYEQIRILSSSTFEVKANSGDKLDIGEDSSLLSLTPSGGEANLYFDTDNYLSDGYVNRWMVSSSVESAEVSITVKRPAPANNSYTYYEIKVDGVHYTDVGPDSSGNVSFTYNGGFSTKDFTIEEKSRAQGGDATSVVINGATVSLVESATTSIESTTTSTSVYLSTSTLPQIPQETASTAPVLIEISTSTAETAAPSSPILIPAPISQPQAATSTATARLQDKLKEFGFMSPDVPSTGYYGSLTRQAVIAFQKSVGIEPVGYYGPLTKKALSEYSKSVKPQETIQGPSINSQVPIASQVAAPAEQPVAKKPGFFSWIIDFFKSIGRFFSGR